VREDPTGRILVSGPFSEDLRCAVAHQRGIGVALLALGHDPQLEILPYEPRAHGRIETTDDDDASSGSALESCGDARFLIRWSRR